MNQERPTPPAIKAGYLHAEAFNLMTYTCDNCGWHERAWNSRDGVTPFILVGRCSVCHGDMTHRYMGDDQYAPDHIPFRTQLIFISMPKELRGPAARFRHTMLVEQGYDDMPDNILEILESEFTEHDPWIIRWGV